MRKNFIHSFFNLLVPLTLAFFFFLVICQDIPAKNALTGYSPLDWINRIEAPENFKKDFPNSIEFYSKSLFMNIYKISFIYLGLSPQVLQKIVILLEILLMVLAYFILVNFLFPDEPQYLKTIIITFSVFSHAHEIDLGNFGQNFYQGLYYNAANFSYLVATILFLKKNYLSSFLCLAFSAMTHPIKGLFSLIFILTIFLTFWRYFENKKRFIFSFLVFIALVLLWNYSVMERQEILSEGIPHRDWILFTKATSYHLYPVQNGVLTIYHTTDLAGLLALVLLFLIYFGKEKNNLLWRMLSCGYISVLVLTVSGLLISYFEIHPTLIKLQLQRADELFVFTGSLLVARGLLLELGGAGLLKKILSIWILLSPFSFNPGWPLLPAIILAAIYLLDKEPLQYKRTILFLMFGIFALFSVYYYSGFISSISDPAYIGPLKIRRFLLSSLLILLASLFHRLFSEKTFYQLIFLLLFIFPACLWITSTKAAASFVKTGLDYKAAQEWALKNTPPDALFMPDPTIYYGWRDYSKRSSFGNMREWLYSGWMYKSDPQAFRLGLQRFQDFELNPYDYASFSPPILGSEALTEKLREVYYSMDDDRRLNMAKKHGIDYFIFRKDRMIEPTGLAIAFENDSFLIVKPEIVRRYNLLLSETFNNITPETLNWSTYSDGRPVTWKWGLEVNEYNDTGAIFLVKPDSHDYWLYTGRGPIIEPPPDSAPVLTLTPEENSQGKRPSAIPPGDPFALSPDTSSLTLVTRMKGYGPVELYIWFYFPDRQPEKIHIATYSLDAVYRNRTISFRPIPETIKYRVAFLLRETNPPGNFLSLDQLKVFQESGRTGI